MGIADLVPGISGGTIALITGIYKDLITALNNLTFKTPIYFTSLLTPSTHKIGGFLVVLC